MDDDSRYGKRSLAGILVRLKQKSVSQEAVFCFVLHFQHMKSIKKVLGVVALIVIAVVMVKTYSDNVANKELGAVALETRPIGGDRGCTTKPTLTVVSPNGGEQYQPGQQVTVTWKSCALAASEKVVVDLFTKTSTGSTTTLVLSTGTNDGTEVVTLPTTLSMDRYGANFKINVRHVPSVKQPAGTPIVQDQSDQYFSIGSLIVKMGTPSYNRTTNTSGQVTSVTYNIPLSVTSYGQTLYLGQTAQLANAMSASNAFAFVFQTSGNPLASDLLSSAAIALSSQDANREGNAFRLDDGTTKRFTLTVTLRSPNTPNSNYRVQLKQIQAFTKAEMFFEGTLKMDLLPPESYRTDYQFINNWR